MNIKNQVESWWWSIDKWILFSTFLLIIIGCILILSGANSIERKYSYNEGYFFKKHLIFVPIAISVILCSSMLSIRHIIILSIIMFVIFLVLSFIPLFQSEIKGASRWIKFFNFTIQPSEFLKPTYIVCSALLLSRFKKKNDNSFLINFFIISVIGLILFLQPDFGMFILIFVTWFLQILLMGLSIKIILSILFFGLIVSCISFFTHDHIKFRVYNFFDADIGDNYQINRSLDAFSNGGAFGKGIGAGTYSKKLPDVHSDFIFALAGEELGFIFLCMILLLYIILIYRVVVLLLKEDNLFIFLSASSLIITLIFQSLINICSTLNMIPTKGMTLPFLSYGGSSLISCSLIIGFILSLTKKKRQI